MKKLLYILFLSFIFQPPIKSFRGVLSTLPREIRLKKILYLFIFFLYLTGLNLFAQQWHVYTHSNSGLPDNGVGCIAIDTNGNKWIGTNNGLAKFNGSTWVIYDTSNSPIPFTGITNVTIDKNNFIWIGSLSGGGLVKFDGVNWTIYNTSNSGIPSNQIWSVAIGVNNVKWIGAGTKLAKFNDTSWTIYNTSDFGAPLNVFYTITEKNNTKWFGMASYGIIKYFDTGYTLYNTGNSQIPADEIRQIFVQQNGLVWIATEFGGLGKFNTNTNNWTAYNSGNSGIENFLHAVTVSRNNLKWIGTFSSGLLKYNDTIFTHFNLSNSPIPSNSVQNITIDSVNNLWIGTDGGLAEFNETGIIGIKNNINNIPKDFILEQNYPNPFNPNTIINYELKIKSYVKIIIYDITGKKIINLIDKAQNEGSYKINFYPENLPSGVYFYSLVTKSFSETKKMVLLK